MIKVANDSGSAELSPIFRKLGVPFRLDEMVAGDFVFSGNGPDDELVTIGIERKTISDLIASMHTGRLTSKQIPNMVEWFDQSYLLVEGIWKADADGTTLLEYTRGNWQTVRGSDNGASFDKIWHFLMSCSMLTGGKVQIIQTLDIDQTAAFVASTWRWFQTPWDGHGSFKVFHTPPPKNPIMFWPKEQDLKDGKITLEEWKRWNCRLAAKEIQGIGWEKSELVAGHFGSVRKMVLASTKDWLQITGVGPILAKRVDTAL